MNFSLSIHTSIKQAVNLLFSSGSGKTGIEYCNSKGIHCIIVIDGREKQQKNSHYRGRGIGVSALAGILLHQGKVLSGSDMEAGAITDKLKKPGVKIFIGHKKGNVVFGTKLVIHSLAIQNKSGAY